jgi:hypothetical protein
MCSVRVCKVCGHFLGLRRYAAGRHSLSALLRFAAKYDGFCTCDKQTEEWKQANYPESSRSESTDTHSRPSQ